MDDAHIVLQKLKIWLSIVPHLPPGKRTLTSPSMQIVVSLAPSCTGVPDKLTIHSIYVEPECRGHGLWSAFLDEVEILGRPLLLQSVLNARLLKFMQRRPGWRLVEGEMSIAYRL